MAVGTHTSPIAGVMCAELTVTWQETATDNAPVKKLLRGRAKTNLVFHMITPNPKPNQYQVLM